MQRVSEVLDHLIEICAEGEHCYRTCARLMQDHTKSRALLHCAQRRNPAPARGPPVHWVEAPQAGMRRPARYWQ